MNGSALYLGRIVHRRIRPLRRRFDARVFSLLVDLDSLPAMAAGLRLFSHNRFNLIAFHDRDHGGRNGAALRPWVEAQMRAAGVEPDGGPIRLLCFPRVLGYVFNPLSVYFCHDRGGALRAVIYEVRNTFGGIHHYVFSIDGARLGDSPQSHAAAKRFHVSPFLPMEARYRFRLTPPAERYDLLIRVEDEAGALMTAVHRAERRPLNDRNLMAAFLAHPLMTFKVIGRIHIEALGLWRRGAPFFRKPRIQAGDAAIAPPPDTTTPKPAG
ncbi:MAG: DUF1365 domain-containing protein [Proteobacteria bacterium]|nr:DUF1365 domain-containing protein [Pseudomonadota bacterium]